MATLGNTIFWIINIFVIGMFLFGMALGWKQGGKRMGLDVLKIIFHFTATIALTLFLTKRYSWFAYQSFYEYLDARRASGSPALSQVEVDKFRFYRSGVIWFFIALIGIDLIIRIVIHIYRRNHQTEKRPLSKRDQTIGEIGGALLIMLWVILLAPIAPTLEKTEVFSNGSDLINKTVISIPVNYVAKPLTKLIMPHSAICKAWDEGFGELAEGLYDVDQWVEENKNDVKVIADLTGIFYSMEASKKG